MKVKPSEFYQSWKIKGAQSALFGIMLTWTLVSQFDKCLPQPEIKETRQVHFCSIGLTMRLFIHRATIEPKNAKIYLFELIQNNPKFLVRVDRG